MTPQEAIKILGITRESLNEKTTLKSFYRKALFKTHPDYGGSTNDIMRVTQAYKDLKYFLRMGYQP